MDARLARALRDYSPEEREALRAMARAEAWRRVAAGERNVDFVLHSSQRKAAALMRASRAPMFYLSVGRQWGKSSMLLPLVLERAWRKPRSLWVWWAPVRSDALDIVEQKARVILGDLPDELQPQLVKGEVATWKLHNGAEIQFFGANNQRARFARGRTADGVVVDEAAEIDDLRYVVEAVSLPMLLHTSGPVWMASTPAQLADHESYAFLRACLSRGDGFRATVHDNPLLTPEQVARHLEACGGAEAATWRREYLAELDVVDQDVVIVPEWSRLRKELARAWARPDYFHRLRRYVSIDPGINDRTGITFAVYDFPAATLRVERAVMLHRARTDQIRAAVEEEEARLWPGLPPPTRIADDAQGRLVLDLTDAGLVVSPAIKDDREASVNLVRTYVATRRLTVDPLAADVLDRQLEHAYEIRRKLARNLEGHFDAFDSLLYLVRLVDAEKGVNPFPSQAWMHSHVRQPDSGRSKLHDAWGKTAKRSHR